MRLSDAINLGRSLVKLDAGTWHRGDRGCAICMAMAAVGKLDEWDGNREIRFELWPWLRAKTSSMPLPIYLPNEDGYTLSSYVGGLATYVELGRISMDQLIDIVRSIEPDEPEIAATVPELTLEEELASIT